MKKFKVTYLYLSSGSFNPFAPTVSTPALRIIGENLLSDSKIEVKFAPVVSKEIKDNIPQNLKYYSSLFHLFDGNFDKEILENCNTEHVLFSLHSIPDLYIASLLLRQNKKVILGGFIVNLFSTQEIRQVLLKLGIKHDILLKNLIIISGYINKNTDLYEILQTWQDRAYDFRASTTKWESYTNILTDSNSLNLRASLNAYSFSISNCWWKKCIFCACTNSKEINLIDSLPAETIIENIIKTTNASKSKTIFIGDDYLQENKKIIEILQTLKNKGYRIFGHSGILLLAKSNQHINFINNCLSGIHVGLETTSNFTLSSIKKGYDLATIKHAINNISKFLRKDIVIYLNLLLDVPYKNLNDIKQNFYTLMEIKEKLEKENFLIRFTTHVLQLNINKPEKILNNCSQLRQTKLENSLPSNICGPWSIYKQYNLNTSINNINRTLITPFLRYDSNNKILPSDIEVLNNSYPDYLNAIFTRNLRTNKNKIYNI